MPAFERRPSIPTSELGVLALSPEDASERAFRLSLLGKTELDVGMVQTANIPWQYNGLCFARGLYDVYVQRHDPEYAAMMDLPGTIVATNMTEALRSVHVNGDNGVARAIELTQAIFDALHLHAAKRRKASPT